MNSLFFFAFFVIGFGQSLCYCSGNGTEQKACERGIVKHYNILGGSSCSRRENALQLQLNATSLTFCPGGTIPAFQYQVQSLEQLPVGVYSFDSEEFQTWQRTCGSFHVPGALVTSCSGLMDAPSGGVVLVCESNDVCVVEVLILPICSLSDTQLPLGIAGVALFSILLAMVVVFFMTIKCGRGRSQNASHEILVPVIGLTIASLIQMVYWSCFLAQGIVVRSRLVFVYQTVIRTVRW